MVGIALYASMTATMSSRRIERALAVDVGFRVVAANEVPDHVTICRFIVRHRDLLENLFAQVVGLAAEAGLIDPTLVAVDGTKLPGDASPSRNQSLGDLRERFAGWADDVEANDAAEDAAEEADPDGGPVEEMFDRTSMQQWIRRRLRERAGEPDTKSMNVTDPDSALLPRSGGGWVQGYNAQAAAVAGGIVVAADVSVNPSDSTMLVPMVTRIGDAVEAATGEPAGVVVADAGYWTSDGIAVIEADEDLPDVLVATGRKLPDQAPDPLPEPAAVDQEAVGARDHSDVAPDGHGRKEISTAMRNRLIESRLTPNAISMAVGLAGNLAAAVLIWEGDDFLGGAAFILGSIMDTLDGRYARASGQGDAVRRVPRSDARPGRGGDRDHGGRVPLRARPGTSSRRRRASFLGGARLPPMVSYTRARAEALGVEMQGGRRHAGRSEWSYCPSASCSRKGPASSTSSFWHPRSTRWPRSPPSQSCRGSGT